jgi:signal transduction histidine kinase
VKVRLWFREHWVTWSLFIGFWTVIGLSFASQFYLSSSLFGYYSVSWTQAISITLGDWYVWALLSLPIIWFARRFPIHRRNCGKLLVIHTTASAGVCVLYILARAGIGQLQGPLVGLPTTFGGAVEKLFLKNSLFNLLVYWVIAAVSHAFDYYRKFHEREWRTAELERRLTQAKLMALRMQLNPHFLFNTLHTISALMHKDVEAADTMIARLSELLRLALENTDANEVTLRQELDFLRRYLEIEQTRFGERLAVRLEVAPDTLDTLVPNLILQPLVENAIRHGIEPHAQPGVIEIHARREQHQLQLQVRDNGSGLASAQQLNEGVGLGNTRARLQQLYGPAHQFSLTQAQEGGLCVTLRLPFRRAAAGESAAGRAAAQAIPAASPG